MNCEASRSSAPICTMYVVVGRRGSGNSIVAVRPRHEMSTGSEKPGVIENARANAAANGVTNCTFVAGDMLRVFRQDLIRQHGRPDVLIVDPPRAGMHPRVVEEIGRLRPERFVYVSCNPSTQVRDLALLADLYELDSVQPVDLFPQTHHVENVVGLRLRSNQAS